MARRVAYSGLVIAGIGFFLTRFTVTLALYEDPIRFYLVGVVPLLLGLGLAAFGVALALADIEASLVHTTARWCVVGAGAMLVLVVLTLLGSTASDPLTIGTLRSRTYLSNFLIGGSVGGTLTGLYAARNRRQRGELRQHANRLEVLNRVLRHEVLNAVNVIRGYAPAREGDPEAVEVIMDRAATIEGAIEEVGELTRTAGTTTARSDTNLADCLTASVETVRTQYPEARISVEDVPEDLVVWANEQLEQVFTHLLENAVVHSTEDTPAVDVTVTNTANTIHVSVSDDGPGLSERQQTLLETGEIEAFDDPGTGFGLNIVRLLVERYGGTIETDVTAEGTTITVGLPRAAPSVSGISPNHSGLVGVRPAAPQLIVVLAAALIAGIPYGIVAEQLGGSVAFIGVFYGIENAVVGWLTHEFHSVVFGFVFAGLVSLAPIRYQNRVTTYLAIGIAWALFLWIVAAGVIAPIWLRLLGIPASIPNLSVTLLASHLAWGISLALLAAAGYRYATPWVARVGERLGRRVSDSTGSE